MVVRFPTVRAYSGTTFVYFVFFVVNNPGFPGRRTRRSGSLARKLPSFRWALMIRFLLHEDSSMFPELRIPWLLVVAVLVVVLTMMGSTHLADTGRGTAEQVFIEPIERVLRFVW
jgi:hypothetical protein